MKLDKELYSTKEIGDMLGITPRSVNRYIERGEFPHAYKTSTVINSHWHIPKNDVEAYFKKIGLIKE